MNLSPAESAPKSLLGSLASLGALDMSSFDEDSDIIRRQFGISVDTKSINEEERTCDFIFSTSALDSYDEIVVQDWDKRMDRYRGNPTVLYHHNRAAFFDKAEDSLPIGFTVEIGVIDGKLRGRIKFVTAEATPLAERVWQGVKQGSLRAVSVGFRSHTIKYEIINDIERLVLSENELYEVSICPMGANHEAVRLSAGQQSQRQRLLGLAKRGATVPEEKKEDMATKDDKPEAVKAVELEAKEARLRELEAQNLELKAKADAAEAKEVESRKALADAQNEALARKLYADAQPLVGKKFLPAQLNPYLELCASAPNEEWRNKFVEFVSAGADLPFTSEVVKTPVPVSAGSSLVDHLKKIREEALNGAE